MPNFFVEEYRKELSLTGYPFALLQPIVMQDGYSLPIGAIADASIYCEVPGKIPGLTSLNKNGSQVEFVVGTYKGILNFGNFDEVVPLFDSAGIFGGILVLDETKIRFISGWKDGEHVVSTQIPFCPRCVEMVPPVGVQRIISDSGTILSGAIVISGGIGTVLQVLAAPAGFHYIEINYMGDPTYSMQEEQLIPIRQVECSDELGTVIIVRGDETNNASLIACNTQESNLFEDALRIIGYDSQIYISLGGK
ncbi:hypothetical protein FACS1894214_0170 [Planctomycetales bacterium]|nr:hypothetical protein FACS1894214_0170 [Planctomycetales bacterium]